MIKTQSGECYQLSGSLQTFDPESPDNDLFNSFDEEAIRIYGIPIYYYECIIQPNTVDKTYMEDRGKLWSIHPIQLYALWEPQANQNMQGLFGIDAPDEATFELNFKDCIKRVGHPPKIGSRIFVPFRSENFEIIQRNDGEYKGWNQLRLSLICRKFQESSTTSGIHKQPQVDFKLNG